MSTTPSVKPSTEVVPTCDRCIRPMDASGWMPKPDGHGGLQRLTVYLCRGCGRLYDRQWGYREPTGNL